MKKKRFLPLALALVMALAMLPMSALADDAELIPPAAGTTAKENVQTVQVDGQPVSFAMYTPNNGWTNYVRLVDLAVAMKGHAGQFNVGYDELLNRVLLTTGTAYLGNSAAAPFHSEMEYTFVSNPTWVNGTAHDVEAIHIEVNNLGYTYYKLADLCPLLGLTVGYDPVTDTISVDSPKEQTAEAQPLRIEKNRTFTVASGTVTAHVVTVDLNDDRVRVKAALPQNKLNATSDFADICAQSGAQVVVDANYFNSNREIKDPIGHVMIDGEFYYGNSGLSTLAIYEDGTAKMGRGSYFYRVKTVDGGKAQQWAAFEVNTRQHFKNQSVYYTPARGASFTVGYPGAVLIIEDNVTTDYYPVAVGDVVNIPANGAVLYSSTEVLTTAWYVEPELGRTVALEPYTYGTTDQNLKVDPVGMVTAVNGAPRLVTDGQMDTTVDTGFDEKTLDWGPRPRTAVGLKADGTMVLVCTASASIQQMREVMMALSCQDAMCLDGGGSTALYYEGETLLTPGRPLATTLQIFVEK